MSRMTKVGVGYNIQIAVDTKHKLIVEQEVHSNVSDMALLAETAQAAKDILGADDIDVVADKGCFVSEDNEACEVLGITPYVPSRSADQRFYQVFSPRKTFASMPNPTASHALLESSSSASTSVGDAIHSSRPAAI